MNSSYLILGGKLPVCNGPLRSLWASNAQHWEMKHGAAGYNLRAQEKQTENSYMNIIIQTLCYLLGASVSISGYYSVLAGWHLWFSGFRLGFSVQLSQMSANKHLLCLSFPEPFFQTCYFLWIKCLVQQSLKMKTNSKWSQWDILGKKSIWKDKNKLGLG